MTRIGGYAGNILFVNLNTGKSTVEPLPQQYMTDYLGGGGINARLMYDHVPRGVDPLSPDNVLIFGSGPFVGTLIPGSAKSTIVCKSPLTGFQGSSLGGHLGMLKFAGYDHLVIRGKANQPAYLKICDGTVEICEASHLWGKDTFETADILWDEVGPDYMVIAIGPAGENLVLDASIIVDKCAAFARTGIGAVMGSKNLKAIVVKGTQGLSVADPGRFTQLIEKVYTEFLAQPFLEEWRTYGTLISLAQMVRAGVIPARNFQESAPKDTVSTFPLDVFKNKLKEGDVACMGCPIGCKHYMQIKEGAHAGSTVAVGCANALVQTFGNFMAVKDWNDIIHLGRTCNRLGLDWYTVANMFALVAELQDKGLIGREKTGGLDFRWGSAETAAQMIEKMARRDGLGDSFAHGIRGLVEHLGEEFAPYASEVKGLGVMLDARSRLSCDAFSHFINPRGGHINVVSFTMFGGDPERLRNSTQRYGKRSGLPEDAIERVAQGALGYNVARLTKWVEDYNYMLDFLGMCNFAMFQRFDTSMWSDLYTALTGLAMTPSGLLRGSERGLNLRKAFNIREGATRRDDRAPMRFLREPVKVGEEQRDPLTPAQVESLIDEYYEERGWDAEGMITPEKMTELGLNTVLMELKSA